MVQALGSTFQEHSHQLLCQFVVSAHKSQAPREPDRKVSSAPVSRQCGDGEEPRFESMGPEVNMHHFYVVWIFVKFLKVVVYFDSVSQSK